MQVTSAVKRCTNTKRVRKPQTSVEEAGTAQVCRAVRVHVQNVEPACARRGSSLFVRVVACCHARCARRAQRCYFWRLVMTRCNERDVYTPGC